MSQAPSRRYLRQLAAVLFAGLGMLATFNLGVDAFGIYRNAGLPHLNTFPVVWSRVSAGERVLDDCQVLLLGSSRVMHGFGPKVPRWGGRKTCNGSVGGTSMHELIHVWNLAKDEPKVKFAIVFLDFHMFHDGRGVNADFAQSRFNPERSGLTYHSWALTSLDAIKYSARMLGRPIPVLDPIRSPVSPVRANRIELYRFLKNGKIFQDYEGPDKSLALLEQVLDDASDRNIQVLLVIPPVHVMVLEAMHRTGVWDDNKHWRRELVRMLDQRLDREIPLWDFASYHGPSMARMPETVREPAHPYWIDVSHQSQQLGFMTVTRIRDAYSGTDGVWEPGFGILLTPDNLEAHLRQLDKGRKRWRRDNPEQADWFDRFADHLDGIEIDPDAGDIPEAGVDGDIGFDVDLPGLEGE
jgi:hypothetical protein